ncbi:PilZ domain-containing protein [Sphingomonas sp. PP-F2F-A104-K0414]|uniref:PilZ domain-containing protein n=1 Tax=Sphingomonas sp. PP-F2F-A104-K0414 TaxID=2135661 RepID=UPI0010E44C01|nr:PilZ domain-containing protein [Sphingomonas sp. PP-F2F-A104-K0414]TCP98500.1 PilZ domain-containing protein [Sphingomonas sp. PP-F2F-A104-K0414]
MARDSLLLVAQCQLGDERIVHEVRVRNLSEGGLMIELDRPAEVGTRVWLNLRGIGEIVGKVAWSMAGRMGIALDKPIDPKKARKPTSGTAKSSVS